MMTDTMIPAIVPMITKAPPPTPAAIRRLTSRVLAVPIYVIRIVTDKIIIIEVD